MPKYVVRGDHKGATYDLELTDDQNFAEAIVRRETANNHYEKIRIEDLEKFQLESYRKLPEEDLMLFARMGDPMARQILAEGDKPQTTKSTMKKVGE